MEEMPIQLLKKDHSKVEELLSACINTNDPKEAAEILKKIIEELDAHMKVEEELFYPLVSSVSEDGERMVKHSKREHQEIKELFGELSGVEEMNEDDFENIKRIKMMKNDHVREEEQKMFPFAEKNLEDELGVILSAKMIALKEKIKFGK